MDRKCLGLQTHVCMYRRASPLFFEYSKPDYELSLGEQSDTSISRTILAIFANKQTNQGSLNHELNSPVVLSWLLHRQLHFD